ncbi:MAG: hypothetical protein LBM71_04320 [Elusimicrobiota bacterium]|jgi:4-hydroxy-tetrahydrodipicolinate reductase|nr:hypothetical protein [Elusimicrobiota bacterium]
MKKVLINGANGKMGQAIIKIIEGDYSLGLKIAALRDNGLNECDENVDLVIDFSLPEGATEAFDLAKKNKAAFLTGTTNLPAAFVAKLQEEKEIPVFYSSNVSIGVYQFAQLLKQAIKLYPNYTRKLHEVHHTQKKDAPSGTAKDLAKVVNLATQDITYERIGKTPGTHTFTLISPTGDEEIILTHKALDRVLFAASAVQVAKWLTTQKAGFYNMQAFMESFK